MTNTEDGAVLNALPGPAAIVCEDGDIVAVNKRWNSPEQIFHRLGLTLPEHNYFEHCQKAVKAGDDYALKIILGLRAVLDGAKESFHLNMPSSDNGSDQGRSWCKLSVAPLDGKKPGALLFFEDISNNMADVQALRETEERYNQQFNNSLSGIIISSTDGAIVDANPAACHILGYTRDELIEGGSSLVMDENHPENKKVRSLLAERSMFEGEMICRHKDGRELPVEVSSVYYRNEEGELRSINTFRDISKQKMTLKQLENEKAFTEATIKSIPGTFFVLNKQQKFERFNEAFTRDLGYTPEEIAAADALTFFPEYEHERISMAIGEAFESGSTHVIADVQSRNNGIRIYHMTANRSVIDEEPFIVGTGTDITDLVAAEKEKDRNYDMISQLFESSPLAMAMINPENKILKVNNSFINLYDYNKLEAIGENIHELLVDEGDLCDAEEITERVFSGETYNREVTRHTKSGKKLELLMSVIPILHEETVVAAYAIYVDLTGQKQLEKNLQKSLNEKEVLLQEVHHRVKNNLAVMAGLIDLQIMEESEPMLEHKLNEIRSRIFSIAKIHENLYGNENVVSIRFDKYLVSVMDALPQNSFSKLNEVTVSLDAEPLILNINQAVPFGLAVNELMNIVFSGHPGGELFLQLRETDNVITLVLEGDALNTDLFERESDSESFPTLLINIFLSQMKGSMKLIRNGLPKVVLEFQQMDVRGSSNSLTKSEISLLN